MAATDTILFQLFVFLKGLLFNQLHYSANAMHNQFSKLLKNQGYGTRSILCHTPCLLPILILRYRALLTSELETIFAEAPLAPNAMAHSRVLEAYERATGSVTKSKAIVDDPKKKRIPGPDDDCPICYDSMHGIAEKSLTFCAECGNALHTECFQQCKIFTLISPCLYEYTTLHQGKIRLLRAQNR